MQAAAPAQSISEPSSGLNRSVTFLAERKSGDGEALLLDRFEFSINADDKNKDIFKKIVRSLDLSFMGEAIAASELEILLTEQFAAASEYVYGHPFWEGCGMAFVANMPQYALRLAVVRDALADDGLLDLVIMPCSNQWRLLAHSFWTALGRNVERAGIIYQRARHVRIASRRKVPIEVDGDAWDHLPVNIEVRPNALRLKVPQGCPRG